MTKFATRLLHWFDQYGRHDLPWQSPRAPYPVWLSEVMLQQTQVATVIPYFQRFMATFADVEQLAKAEQDEVLALWAGLGYYSRARNLHKAAQLIYRQGYFPKTVEQWQELPGVGRSTAAAIVSQVEDMPLAILDGNVKRVLCRFFAIEGWPGDKKVADLLWQKAESLLPDKRGADYTQAIMDLGATICKRGKADCTHCPLQGLCKGSMLGIQNSLPQKKPGKKLPQRKKYFALVQYQNRLLLYKRPPLGIWGGLWSLPEFDTLEEIEHFIRKNAFKVKKRHTGVEPLLHKFSHFQLELQPVWLQLEEQPLSPYKVMEDSNCLWYNYADIPKGMATPIKKLIEETRNKNYEQNGKLYQAG